ncbi:carbohydrate esterase family 1 protein [Plicaturopsis crispa FD-325 SS-3]|nr:carbohydrate esterase family 1 protein [Plicaturopsis crispa FD-325 SS-3]
MTRAFSPQVLLALVALGVAHTASAASSGCGSQSSWVFDGTGHANRQIGDRTYLVHIPDDYNSSVAHAVVLSFHGAGGTSAKQELISGFSEPGTKLNNKGVIGVYPMGALGPGKSGHGSMSAWQGAPYAKAGVDDIAFTQSIVSELQSNLCVDEKRIYAAGKSNGGGFVNLLACTSSTAGLFAAFAPVSAALYPDTHPLTGCNPGRAVPLLNFHGLADTVIPFGGQAADSSGNTSYALPNITEYREAWATRNGCPTTQFTDLTKAQPNTTLKTWDCTSKTPRAIVMGYTVAGLGHSWPTTAGLDGSGPTSVAAYNATPTDIIPFFDAFPLP